MLMQFDKEHHNDDMDCTRIHQMIEARPGKRQGETVQPKWSNKEGGVCRSSKKNKMGSLRTLKNAKLDRCLPLGS